MARVKKTKQELKAQRRALERYHRYLPTLELKKQQLQREVRLVEATLRERAGQEDAIWARVRPWIKLLASAPDIGAYVQIERVDLDSVNIAGVNVPRLAALDYARPVIDYYATPAWLEDAIAALRELTTLRAEQAVLRRQRKALAEELRITAQRVNLFEKVMIPRAEENIRIIRIALGDAQTAAVARAKLAKTKGMQLRSGKAAG
jgi:V/A-type H+-transporting ATPase subunit D